MNVLPLSLPIPCSVPTVLRRSARCAIALAVAASLAGCGSFGTNYLRADQVDYARALGDAKKREMLAMIVGLRFGDLPAFIAVTQIIAAYQFGASAGPTMQLGDEKVAGSFASATGTVSYANHPTFTYAPTTGEAYANAYIRPLPATLVLPLADSGIPIDLLLRLAAQSIGGLQNDTPLGGPDSDGSPGFFELLRVLRQLQLAGKLTFHYTEDDRHVGHTYLVMGGQSGDDDSESQADIARVRQLLHLKPGSSQYEIGYGTTAGASNTVPIVTRSILGILSNLGAQIQVPEADIKSGATPASVHLVGGETRPTVIVHVGDRSPGDAYVSVPYENHTYWIERTDFDSKYAFTVLQNLISLAEASGDTKAPIVTIPAG
ncbi:MAG TPA: hypothetical protein VGG24_13930 [Paraburkholderia sp.]